MNGCLDCCKERTVLNHALSMQFARRPFVHSQDVHLQTSIPGSLGSGRGAGEWNVVSGKRFPLVERCRPFKRRPAAYCEALLT
jgi:hypothetical protein